MSLGPARKCLAMQTKIFLSLALLLGLGACSQQTASDAGFRPTATIQDIMDAEIDPSADFIWESVAHYSTPTGTEDKRPSTDEDWEKLRLNALRLIEGTNLLIIPGRRVAIAGKQLDREETASEAPEDIQKAIDSTRATFIGLAHNLHDAGTEALRAIEAKNVAGRDAVGEKPDAAWESCHRTYWYPNAPEPIKTFDEKAEAEKAKSQK